MVEVDGRCTKRRTLTPETIQTQKQGKDCGFSLILLNMLCLKLLQTFSVLNQDPDLYLTLTLVP